MDLKKITFLSITLILSSCVMYYNTNDVRNDLNENINITKENYAKVENDYKEKSKIYESLSDDIVDVTKNPFKNIATKKQTFDEAYQNIRRKKDLLYSYQGAFEKLAAGKGQIKSNEAEWDQLKKIKNNVQSTGNEISALAGTYTAASNQLGASITNSGLGKVETKAYSQQLEENIGSMEAQVKDIEGKLKAYQVDLNKAKQNNIIKDSTYKSRSSALTKMTLETQKIKTASNKLSLLKTSFQETTKNRETIWVGENTKSNAIMKNIEAYINTIKSAQAEFMSLSVLLKDSGE